MKKRIIELVILSSLLILLVFTGCRHNETIETTPEPSTEAMEEVGFKATENTPLITFDQIRKIESDMTYREVIKILGEGEDVGSGIRIYVYQTEDGKPFVLSVMNDSEKIGKSGEELIKDNIKE